MVRDPDRARRRPPWAELTALAAVMVIALLSWLLVSGVATGIYRHFAVHGDPSLLAMRVPGPDPAVAVAPTPDRTVSQLGHYGYFWSERAFHYRVALMFAGVGAPAPSILHHDVGQQYPEGVDAWREYTLLMEPVYGFLYRLAGNQSRPFVEFLLGLVPLIHVLLLWPVYAAARTLGGTRPAAVAAALVTASCSLGFARLAGSLLLKEDFALLLLMGFVALHLWAWRRGSRLALAAAAALLVAVLASWHLSQYLVAVVLGATAVARAAGPEPSVESGRSGTAWLMPAAYAGAFALAGLTPSLRERWFLLSPATVVVAAWLAAVLLTAGRGTILRVGGLLALTAALLAAAFFNPVHGGDYGHVSGLLVAKLRHGLVRPDDPTLLPFAVRQFWTSPFHTPDLAEIVGGLGFHAPLLAAAVLWSLLTALRPGTPPLRRGFLLVVPVFAAAWILAARLGVVLLPFAAVAAALMLQSLAGRLAGSPVRAGWIAALVLTVAAGANLPTNLASPLAMARDFYAGRPVPVAASDDTQAVFRAELFRWLTAGTPGPGSVQAGAPAAVLTDIALSPQVLLYAQRPVLLNSQFENHEIRERTERYHEALFAEDPGILYAFAREHGARCLVIDRTVALADGPGSTRWMAAVPAPLTTARTVVRLHLDPLGVPGFAPLWDNEYYRVFVVLAPGETVGLEAWETRFGIWWQPENLTVSGGGLVNLDGDRARLQEFEAATTALQAQQAAILAAAAQRRPTWPDLLTMQRQLALARFRACSGADPAVDDGAMARLANAAQTMLADVDPGSGVPVGRALGRLLDGDGGQSGWTPLLAALRAEPTHHAVAAQLAAMIGRPEAAARGFLAAAARWDEQGAAVGPAPTMRRQLWDEALLWLVAAERCDEARDLARRWAPQAGRGEGPGALVRQLAAAAAASP